LAGLPPNTIFHLCWDFNFFWMLALIFWKGGPLLAGVLQARSRLIRRAIDDAQRLAEDAAKRLAQVEKRWAQLDSEIAAIRALAEVETKYEEQVLNARTTEDIRRIMEYSQSEIDRATQRARHELKAFAADLGIHIAQQSIKIDEITDHELVKSFLEGLGDQELAQTTFQPPVQSERELAART
jgi:F0F1-type ATP synthase membrane subunit b/b'